jgi:cytochrome d ubiquinol oxidase subunit II
METACYAVIWLSLGLYALLAGADFGVGIWLIAARFAKRHGELIRRDALGYFGPVWEVNTLFLVFFMVGLISAFPRAIGLLGHALIGLVLAALVMFVLRSGAYAWMHHGPERARRAATIVFGVSSVIAGLGLGYAAAAPASGLIEDRSLPGDFYTSSVALAALPLTPPLARPAPPPGPSREERHA